MRLRVGSENMENLMTVVDRLDELQASSVGRRECSNTQQQTGARRMDVHVDTYSQPCPRATAVATAQARVMEVSQGSGICAWSCCHLANKIKHVPGYSPMSLVFKNNTMTRGSQGFVGQSLPNLAHV